jgi:acylphosphatase
MNLIRRIVISGRVQGVGYRAWMQYTALDNGLDGWVRNRRDGTVEAFVQGDTAALDAIVAWCRRGPSAARVTSVDVSPAAPDSALAGFTHRPTA